MPSPTTGRRRWAPASPCGTEPEGGPCLPRARGPVATASHRGPARPIRSRRQSGRMRSYNRPSSPREGPGAAAARPCGFHADSRLQIIPWRPWQSCRLTILPPSRPPKHRSGWSPSTVCCVRRPRPGGPPPPRPERASRPARGQAAVHGEHALRQHDSGRASSADSGRRRNRAPRSRASCAGTRWRWWCAPTGREAGIGGHISTYASAATLYEVGFNHFFRGRTTATSRRHGLFPGACRARHLRPGVSGRALDGEQLENFRRELGRAGGCRRIRIPG